MKGSPCVGCHVKRGQINGGHGFKGWVCADCWCGCGRNLVEHSSDEGCYAIAGGMTAEPIHRPARTDWDPVAAEQPDLFDGAAFPGRVA